MHLEKSKKDCSFDKRVVYLIVLQMIKYNEQSHTKLRINSEGIDKELLPYRATASKIYCFYNLLYINVLINKLFAIYNYYKYLE
ncbi:hypothetical protein EZS27_038683 [termite gut metagenome]|uniref:Uncharacterized protein n=1 Tax=termite gut metagenome TaxID=433724 RepID=A0A5J4PK00_9ZZZZ